jgi:hypothetical protein
MEEAWAWFRVIFLCALGPVLFNVLGDGLENDNLIEMILLIAVYVAYLLIVNNLQSSAQATGYEEGYARGLRDGSKTL